MEAMKWVKPVEGMHQTATQVKVLSPVIINVKEVDSFHMLEDNTIHNDRVRYGLLFRGLRPRYDTVRIQQELGRTMPIPGRRFRQVEEVRRSRCGMVVGTAHNRGVVGVMSSDPFSKGTRRGWRRYAED